MLKLKVDPSHGTLNGLMTSGRQYAQRVVGENKKIRESVRTLQALHTMRDSGLKVRTRNEQFVIFICNYF